MEVDQGSFTPLVFTVAGGIGGECRAFYSRLATLPSLRKGTGKSKVTSSIQSKINFELPRSMLLCLRGSRLKLVNEKLDIELDIQVLKIIDQNCYTSPTFVVFFNNTIIVQFYVCNR